MIGVFLRFRIFRLLFYDDEDTDWIFKDEEEDWFVFLFLDLSFVFLDLILSLLAATLYFDFFVCIFSYLIYLSFSKFYFKSFYLSFSVNFFSFSF